MTRNMEPLEHRFPIQLQLRSGHALLNFTRTIPTDGRDIGTYGSPVVVAEGGHA